jgi:hypothetical protein
VDALLIQVANFDEVPGRGTFPAAAAGARGDRLLAWP